MDDLKEVMNLQKASRILQARWSWGDCCLPLLKNPWSNQASMTGVVDAYNTHPPTHTPTTTSHGTKVSWQCATQSKDVGTLARKNLKEKNYLYILLLHMILTCWAAIGPVAGADFCYHAIALGVHIIGGFVTCLDKFVYKCRSYWIYLLYNPVMLKTQ